MDVLFFIACQTLGDLVIIITRPDKKKVVFFNDKSAQLNIDDGKLAPRRMSEVVGLAQFQWAL